MNISLIVAASLNNVIGKNNQLLWHLPNDMKFFKQTTWAMPVIMGRKTFESMNCKLLNGRLNIIITRQKNFESTGVVVTQSIESALSIAEQHLYKEVFIIGGGETYAATLPKANTIFLTRVDTKIDGDTFFPEINLNDFELKFEDKHQADEKHLFNYTFQTWIRK